MSCTLAISTEADSAQVLGTRYSAIQIRQRVEQRLQCCDSVQLDFSGVFVTQSFIDELFGPLILRMGPAIIERVAFSGCSEETRSVLQLVFASRLQDFASLHKNAG